MRIDHKIFPFMGWAVPPVQEAFAVSNDGFPVKEMVRMPSTPAEPESPPKMVGLLLHDLYTPQGLIVTYEGPPQDFLIA